MKIVVALTVFLLFTLINGAPDHQEDHDQVHQEDHDQVHQGDHDQVHQGDHDQAHQGHHHHHHHHQQNSEDQSHEDNSHGSHRHGHHGHRHGSRRRARDCSDVRTAGHNQTGVYKIKPAGCHHKIDVLCDMDTDGGNWTVIQRRGEYGNADDYFYKTWDEYKDGFGELDKEFWIGNYHINHLTEQGDYELRIDMWSLTDNHTYAKYGRFRVENETRNYAIHVGDFSGDTRDCMENIDGMAFSTHDRDNDLYDTSCAVDGMGAWWYRDCSSSNLNGPHLADPSGNVARSIYWFGRDGNPTLMKKTTMMVRKKI